MIETPLFEKGLNVIINTTEDCNLRCKYCYEIKKKKKSIDFETCKKFIDILVTDENLLGIEEDEYNNIPWLEISDGIVLDFIGGDSLIDPQLLDQIITYLIKKLYTTQTPIAKQLRRKIRVSISTNGTLFVRQDVRDFCEKWKDILEIGVSIDGCPEIHDKNRIFPNGSGSMEVIMKGWPWYKETFPRQAKITKATCNKDSIPYLYESLKWMHEELGLIYINQNFIMEDMHLTEEDLKLLDKQLYKCEDYVLEHCDDLYWAPFDETQFVGAHLSRDRDWERGFCGAGLMPTLSVDGEVYPCFRFLPHTQEGKENALSAGNVNDGYLKNKSVFKTVRQNSAKSVITKEPKCRSCEFESACAYCIGGCYAEFGDFIRTTHICPVTQLLVKHARNYWKRYNELRRIRDNIAE